MDWTKAVDLMTKNKNVAQFSYGKELLTDQQKSEINGLCLYFSHAISIMLTKATAFNCLLKKTEFGQVILEGDGELTCDTSLAMLICLESVHNVAELADINFKPGTQVDIKDVLDNWHDYLESLPNNHVIDCKEFTSTVMSELVNDISNRTIIEPSKTIIQPN